MGICICEIHGRTGLISICPHIAKKIKMKQKLPRIITASFYFGDFAGSPDAPMTMKLNYCNECVEQKGFPSESSEMSEDEFENMSEHDFDASCVKCFSELKDGS